MYAMNESSMRVGEEKMDLDDNAEPPRDSEQCLEVTKCHWQSWCQSDVHAKSKCHTGHRELSLKVTAVCSLRQGLPLTSCLVQLKCLALPYHSFLIPQIAPHNEGCQNCSPGLDTKCRTTTSNDSRFTGHSNHPLQAPRHGHIPSRI